MKKRRTRKWVLVSPLAESNTTTTIFDPTWVEHYGGHRVSLIATSKHRVPSTAGEQGLDIMPGKCPLEFTPVVFCDLMSPSMPCSPPLQGLGRIARREKAYREQLRKSFGGCLVSGKLQGFASEGRSVKKTPVDQDDPDKDLLGQLDMRHGAEDQWADHSDSDSDSYSDSDSLESSDGNDEHASNDVVEEDDEDIATTKGTVQGIFPGGGCPNESESAPRHGGTDGNAEAEETKKDAAPGSEPGEGGACAGTRESSISTSAKPSSDAKAKEAAMSVGDNSPTPPDIPVRSDVPGS